MRLLASLCGRTEMAREALVVVDPARAAVEPVRVVDPAVGAFGLLSARSTIYAVFDHGRPSPDEPERSELRAPDARTFSARCGRRSV